MSLSNSRIISMKSCLYNLNQFDFPTHWVYSFTMVSSSSAVPVPYLLSIAFLYASNSHQLWLQREHWPFTFFLWNFRISTFLSRQCHASIHISYCRSYPKLLHTRPQVMHLHRFQIPVVYRLSLRRINLEKIVHNNLSRYWFDFLYNSFLSIIAKIPISIKISGLWFYKFYCT